MISRYDWVNRMNKVRLTPKSFKVYGKNWSVKIKQVGGCYLCQDHIIRDGYAKIQIGGKMKAKYYWIRERHNPQLGVYYVLHGQMPIKEARKYEKSLYGHDYMLKFDNEESYNTRIAKLKASGERIVA